MSKKNNDQNQVPEETKEETPEEVTEASQEKQESSQEEALQQALREQEDKYLRLLAEYDNYRKRSQKEKENAMSYTAGTYVCNAVMYTLLHTVQSDPHIRTIIIIFILINNINNGFC